MINKYAAPGPIDEEVLKNARILWDYHHMHHVIENADCILALGSHDIRVAHRAAELWLQQWAPYIIFSGGLGNLTSGMWTESEADLFAREAERLGVPASNIFIENKSTNTGENIQFTEKLLQEKGLNPQKLIVVQKPYMERRTYATVKRWWSDKDLIITSPQYTLEEYPLPDIPIEKVIHIMVGDMQRIRVYPDKGFQITQHIPDDVWEAYSNLVGMGYVAHLI